MINLFTWWHHITNPHCIHCKDELDESFVCLNCEYLRLELDKANAERLRLLEIILPKPILESEINQEQPQPANRHVPWRVKQQMLEAEDRERAKLMRDNINQNQDKTVESLEREIGINDDGKEAEG